MDHETRDQPNRTRCGYDPFCSLRRRWRRERHTIFIHIGIIDACNTARIPASPASTTSTVYTGEHFNRWRRFKSDIGRFAGRIEKRG